MRKLSKNHPLSVFLSLSLLPRSLSSLSLSLFFSSPSLSHLILRRVLGSIDVSVVALAGAAALGFLAPSAAELTAARTACFGCVTKGETVDESGAVPEAVGFEALAAAVCLAAFAAAACWPALKAASKDLDTLAKSPRRESSAATAAGSPSGVADRGGGGGGSERVSA
jgi:hypothetical protein